MKFYNNLVLFLFSLFVAGTINIHAEETKFAQVRQELLFELNQWADQGPPDETRISTRKLILQFLIDPDATCLDLRHEEISSLPDIFDDEAFQERLKMFIWPKAKLKGVPDSLKQLEDQVEFWFSPESCKPIL